MAKIDTKITANNSDFLKKLTEAKQEVRGFARENLKEMQSMIGGAFAVGAVVQLGAKALESADKISNLSKTLEVSSDALQGLYAVGARTNVDTSMIDSALTKVAKARDAVIIGNKEMKESFLAMGISAETVAASSIQELFELIAKGSQESGGNLKELENLGLGKSLGADLGQLLAEVADNGFGAIIAGAKEAGQVIDSEVISQLAEANDDLERIKGQATSSLTRAGVWVANQLQDAAAIVTTDAAARINKLQNGNILGALKLGTMQETKDALAQGDIGEGKREHDRAWAEQQRKNKEEERKKARESKYKKNNLTEDEQNAIDDAALDNKAYQERSKAVEKDAKDKAIKQKRYDAALNKEELNYADKVLNDRAGGLNIRAADSLASTGRFVGKQTDNGASVAERTLRVEERLEKLSQEHNARLKELAERMDRVNDNLED